MVLKSKATSPARPSVHSTRTVSRKAGSSALKALFPSSKTSTDAHIKRFQEQTEVVNIMESEDLGVIKAKINELKARDPGAFAADPIVVEVKEAAADRKLALQVQTPSSSKSRRDSTRSRRRSSSWMQRLHSVLDERLVGISAYCTASWQALSYL